MPYNYAELADELIPYIKEMGYTHVELLPSPNIRLTAAGAIRSPAILPPPARYGTPKDFMTLWISCMRPASASSWTGCLPTSRRTQLRPVRLTAPPAMRTPTPAAASTRNGAPWSSTTGASEVQSFLMSSACSGWTSTISTACVWTPWQSMLYLDYNRKDGEWEPNVNGGKENLEAIAFLQKLNAMLGRHPHKYDDRRGVHRMADGHKARFGRPGLQLQVEHGLDERYAQLHED